METMTMPIPADSSHRRSRGIAPLLALTIMACAAAPPPPSRSANDPSNPAAEETPAPPATVSAAVVDAGAAPVVYACPMHPEVTSAQPGQKCPKCGMALVPRKATP